MISKLFRTIIRAFRSAETNLVNDFNKDPQKHIEQLISYFLNCKKFNGFGRYYHSPSWNVKVCCDIYGPEVKIREHNELLDCCPEAYGLTDEQGKRLYNAILSCVPGTIDFKNRVNKNLAKEDHEN